MYQPKRNPGDYLMIFADPLTQNYQEGNATLMIFVDASGGLERWYVMFDDSPGMHYLRFIKIPENDDRRYSPYRHPGDWGPNADIVYIPGGPDKGGTADN